MRDPIDRKFLVELDCHYLLQAPDVIDERTALVVALHGFGENPERMLRAADRLFGTQAVIVALQGPYQFFLSPAAREVGYGWITNRRPAESIRLHRDMVLHALEEAGNEFGIGKNRRILMGFSQSVALNYRFASACPGAVGGVLAVCGGLPGDWDKILHDPIPAPVLHVAAQDDAYYPPQVTQAYEATLRRHAADVQLLRVDGGHAIPASRNEAITAWMNRILGRG
jgi:predicted esterase